MIASGAILSISIKHKGCQCERIIHTLNTHGILIKPLWRKITIFHFIRSLEFLLSPHRKKPFCPGKMFFLSSRKCLHNYRPDGDTHSLPGITNSQRPVQAEFLKGGLETWKVEWVCTFFCKPSILAKFSRFGVWRV